MRRTKKQQRQALSAAHGCAVLLAMGFVPVIALMSKLYPQYTMTWRTLLFATAFVSLALLFAYWSQSPRPEGLASGEGGEDTDLT